MSFASALDGPGLERKEAIDAFTYWWEIGERAPWIEQPNVRRSGRSGVRRARLHGQTFYLKIQVDHCHRSWRHPLGRPTALREAEALEACHRLGVQAPQIEFCATRRVAGRQHTLLVTRGLDEYVDLDRFLHDNAGLLRGPERLHLLDAVAVTCARLHVARWQHSALYAKHVFVARRAGPDGRDTQFDVALIDLEKARRRLSVQRAARHDIAQLQRHCAGLDAHDWEYFTTRHALHLTSLQP